MADWKLMYKLLSDTDWEAVFNHSDINDVWINFKAAVNNAVKASIPTNKRIPWRVKSNPKIRSALRYARRCHASYKLLRNNESLLKLLHAKDHLQELIDKQVDTYEQYIVSSLHENPNRFWSYVNSKLKNKRNIFKMVKVNNELIEDPSQIAEALNKYFYNSFNHNSNDTGFSSVNMPIADGSKLTDIEINHNLVSSIIKHLPKKRSEDYDGFSYAILKGGGDILSFQLTRLFKLSFTMGLLPQDWKKSIIFPIKKKASSITVENFRPINVTSCVCRVFERIIRNAILCFLDESSLINKSQHGFLKGRSTTTALLTYSNDLTYSLDNGMCVDSAYFDFSKAFDRVRHDYLIHKLSKIGIAGPLLSWINNYLINRTQTVNVHGCLSSEMCVSSGVIQGSVLGPLFFTIYVNDVDLVINNCTMLKYADDIRIYRCFKPDTGSQLRNRILIQEDINALTAWSKLWDLNFNTTKCCILHFGRSNEKAVYKINDQVITNKYNEKDLGILFSVNLKFDEHIDSIVKKANQQLGIIARVFKGRNYKTILPLYKTFVRPFLEYNSVIWSPYTKKNDYKLEKIQIKMFNLIKGFRSLSYLDKLKKANLSSLRARRIQHQLLIMYKMINKIIDLEFDDFFKMNNFNKTRGNAFKLLFPKTKTNVRHKFFTSSIIKHWNRLKTDDINVRSIQRFKKNVHDYLISEDI